MLKTREDLPRELPVAAAVVAEVGVAEGSFAALLLERGPSCLVLVDPWIHQPVRVYRDDANLTRDRFEDAFTSVQKRFTPYANVEIVRGFSVPVAETYADGFFDVVYIDANHAVDAVFADLLAWFPKVRPGGWLCGDDFAPMWPGVVEAVLAFSRRLGRAGRVLDLRGAGQWGFRVSPEDQRRFDRSFLPGL